MAALAGRFATFSRSVAGNGVVFRRRAVHAADALSHGGDFPSTWNVLEEFRAQGRARSIGVSNFQPDHLARLKQETATVPAVNQIEAHPYFPNDSVRRYGESRGIVTQAWSPLAQGAILTDESLVNIASTYGRGVAQIVLRWHVERESVVFPRPASALRRGDRAWSPAHSRTRRTSRRPSAARQHQRAGTVSRQYAADGVMRRVHEDRARARGDECRERRRIE